MFKFLKLLRGSVFLQASVWICISVFVLAPCVLAYLLIDEVFNSDEYTKSWLFLTLAKYVSRAPFVAPSVAALSIFEFIIRKFVLLKPIVAKPEPTEKLPKILDRIYSLFFFFITVLNFLAFILCLILLNVFMEIFIY